RDGGGSSSGTACSPSVGTQRALRVRPRASAMAGAAERDFPLQTKTNESELTLMRKLIPVAASIAAIAALAAPSLASADVARYQSQTSTFTTTQPAGAFSQFDNVWTHNYKVTIN